ncbi:Glucokinase regulatory protein [Geodia barretti]|uniref:Glucokinase regulatory protein n=2 Tax=Geodia barretti TaxID=519541 RepID=A0AA35RPF5_GEOBA|nr:Glucokinase regulatory protein [Geodia barretti]
MAGLQEPRRVTELSNELTRDIDTADPLGIVRRLCGSDAQLFAGWGGHPGVNDPVILDRLWKLSLKTAALLKENQDQKKNNRIVFSGCGTSGRIAWLCSWTYNRILQKFGHTPCFHYLIAGGDRSLIISNELPEDDPPKGAEDLKKVAEGADHVMFVGITCGLSAPYVAGQIDHSMHQPNMTSVLMGFNPVSLSRNAPIEKWDKTCRQVFLELETLSCTSDSAFIINPIVGPEPITGSSRMKGGSTTAVLLGTVFLTSLQTLLGQPILPSMTLPAREPEETEVVFDHSLSPSLSPMVSLLDCYSQTYQTVYRHSGGVASLLKLAASCICQPSGRLIYLGADTLGALGLVDASEMVPTYGVGLEEFRGFVAGGWEGCGNTEGDLSGYGKTFRVSLSQFESDVLPSLTDQDCVLCLHGSSQRTGPPHLHTIVNKVLASPAKCGLLVMAENGMSCNHLLDKRYETAVLIRLPYYHAFGKECVFAGFALKLVLNAISTGANILKGRVYGNEMINLRLSNDKLFERAIAIIEKWSGANEEDAKFALLRAIYKQDDAANFQYRPISSHITEASSQNMVVPLALLLAGGRSSVSYSSREKAAPVCQRSQGCHINGDRPNPWPLGHYIPIYLTTTRPNTLSL